jgi:hypothetical protein
LAKVKRKGGGRKKRAILGDVCEASSARFFWTPPPVHRDGTRQVGSPRRLLRQAFRRQGGLRQGAGAGIGEGVFWTDMGVVNLPSGRPSLQLTGGAAARLAAMTPAGMRAVIHLTLTDEYPLAQAQVLIEAAPC